MTKEQLKRAIELHRSLEQLEGISDYLRRPYEKDKFYFRTSSMGLGGKGYEMPNTLACEFCLVVEKCIKEVEEEIKKL